MEHWFVSNVDLRFENTERMLNFMLIPYLQSRLAIKATDPMIHWPIMSENRHVFSPNIEAIMPYARSTITPENISKWWSSNTVDALINASGVLDIPFSGATYSLRDFEAYYGIQSGEFNPRISLRSFEYNTENPYKRSHNWKNSVSKFKTLYFITNREDLDALKALTLKYILEGDD